MPTIDLRTRLRMLYGSSCDNQRALTSFQQSFVQLDLTSSFVKHVLRLD